MDFALQPHLYKTVPVICWPWLFWQLWRIALWGKLTGRDVMVAVDKTGQVCVTQIGGDPTRWTPSANPHAHQRNLTIRLAGESRAQWRSRIEAVYAPGQTIQHWIISPRALGETVSQFVIPDLTLPPVGPGLRDPVWFWLWFCEALSPAGTLREAGSGQRCALPVNQAQGCCPPYKSRFPCESRGPWRLGKIQTAPSPSRS